MAPMWALSMICLVLHPWAMAGAGIGPQEGIALSILNEHQVPPNAVDLRLPPTFGQTNASSKPWIPLPPGWLLGDWFITFSNQELYRLFRNFIWTLTRPCTDDACYAQEATKLDTLASFQLANDTQKPNATYCAYSHDTAVAVDAYQSVPTGSLASQNNTYEIISWGYDSKGVAFIVVYETPTASQTVASLDIFSRDPSGPSSDTLNAIKVGIKRFGNRDLIELLTNVKKTPQDGGRAGDAWPSCNATCRTNEYSVPLD
ncbi:hypothetical protein RBB50_003648 [Rhinocladiella similis]